MWYNGGDMAATDTTATKISTLLGLTPDQTQIVTDYGAIVAKTPPALLGATSHLLEMRRTRLIIFGPEKIGKTTSILGLARELARRSGRPLDHLNADGDAQIAVAAAQEGIVSSTPIGFRPYRGDPDDTGAVMDHLVGMSKTVLTAIMAGGRRLGGGQTCGLVLDTLSAVNSRLYAHAGIDDMDSLAEEGGKGAIAAQRIRMRVANILRTLAMTLLASGDWGDKILADQPPAPGPYLIGLVGHARSLPRTKDGEPVFGSHDHWVLGVSESIRTMIAQQSDGILLFGPKTSPMGERTPADRVFVFEGAAHAAARLVLGDAEERAIAVAAAKKASLADFVCGIYDHRIRRGLSVLRTALDAAAKPAPVVPADAGAGAGAGAVRR